MADGNGDNPILLSEVLAFFVAILAGVSGYIGNQVMGDSKKMYRFDQDLHDLRLELDRMHAEIFRRIERIENRLFMGHNGDKP